MKLTLALLDATVGAARRRRRRARSRNYQLGIGEMLWSATTNALSQYVKLRPRRAQGGEVGDRHLLSRQGCGRQMGPRQSSGARSRSPRTISNVTITNQRSFAAKSLPIAEVKAAGKAVGATVNDTVMALCSGALMRYSLTRRDA